MTKKNNNNSWEYNTREHISIKNITKMNTKNNKL